MLDNQEPDSTFMVPQTLFKHLISFNSMATTQENIRTSSNRKNATPKLELYYCVPCHPFHLDEMTEGPRVEGYRDNTTVCLHVLSLRFLV